MASRFFTLASNSFEEVLRRKVVYILVFVALLLVIQAGYGFVYMNLAESAGELELLSNMRGRFVLTLFEMIQFWGVVLAVFLGAVAISTEVKNRTIVPVLSRPVKRSTFFLAKWAGTSAFLLGFVGVGVLVGAGIAIYWELYPSTLFGLGVAELFLTVVLISAVSIALSTVTHPVAAGGGAFFVAYMGGMADGFSQHPNALLRGLALGARYLSPAHSPEPLLESGLLKGLVDPDYALYASVLAENAGYTVFTLLAGAAVFGYREIRIR